MELRWKRACCNSENFCCDMTASACCNYVNCNSVHIFDITLRIRHFKYLHIDKTRRNYSFSYDVACGYLRAGL